MESYPVARKGLAVASHALETYGLSCQDDVSLLDESDLSKVDVCGGGLAC